MRTNNTQGQLWSTAPAEWATYIEPAFLPLYLEVLEQVALHEESALLDVGCGAGLFLSMAAGTGALVHGIDAAPGLLAIAKQRVPGAYLMVEDMHALPYIDGSFDVITGLQSFDYTPSFEDALVEARRVVKRHGKIVVSTWANDIRSDAQSVMAAVQALIPGNSIQNTFSKPDEEIHAICSRIGLRLLDTKIVSCPWTFTSDAALIKGFVSIATCALAVQQEGEAAVSQAIIAAAQNYNMADEVYYLQNSFMVHVTEKI